ncbi:hypothetical protein SKAU_G00232370 [Synaphobranchus kaupii]|uniref:Uncharacterized protein n=1 Tax=Synaphobranchus kaupii TaxID=118154 RepID=A0A9Q1ITH7_SYNKA|nr:hypothetical protein SKAU_G00232370 [Synaphobranchus kaupii]
MNSDQICPLITGPNRGPNDEGLFFSEGWMVTLRVAAHGYVSAMGCSTPVSHVDGRMVLILKTFRQARHSSAGQCKLLRGIVLGVATSCCSAANVTIRDCRLTCLRCRVFGCGGSCSR